MPGYVMRGTRRSARSASIFLNVVASTIVARAGGGKASATPTTSGNVLVSTVATAADSILLPSPRAGDIMWIRNAGSNALQAFAAGTATIDGAATGTGVSLTNGKHYMLTCYADGAWLSTLLN